MIPANRGRHYGQSHCSTLDVSRARWDGPSSRPLPVYRTEASSRSAQMEAETGCPHLAISRAEWVLHRHATVGPQFEGGIAAERCGRLNLHLASEEMSCGRFHSRSRASRALLSAVFASDQPSVHRHEGSRLCTVAAVCACACVCAQYLWVMLNCPSEKGKRSERVLPSASGIWQFWIAHFIDG